jgi:hypothetical protein
VGETVEEPQRAGHAWAGALSHSWERAGGEGRYGLGMFFTAS